MKSLALVLFSVCTQAAVGLVLVSATILPATGARLACPLAVLGLIASLAHLGAPLGAARALTNLRSSWLSREVLLTSLFAAAAGLYGYVWTGRAMALLAALLGLLALYCQGMVYQLPTRPEWRHWASVWNAYPAALKLGALILALVAARTASQGALVYLGYLLLGAAAWLMVGVASYAAYLARASRQTASLLLGDTWFWVRLVAGIMLPAFAGLALAMGLAPDLLTTGGALAAAVVGELLGRNLFYRSVLDQLPLF
jgi:anaerobic dimethyl sulfoxide reductase subunit C (anchor subunit)